MSKEGGGGGGAAEERGAGRKVSEGHVSHTPRTSSPHFNTSFVLPFTALKIRINCSTPCSLMYAMCGRLLHHDRGMPASRNPMVSLCYQRPVFGNFKFKFKFNFFEVEVASELEDVKKLRNENLTATIDSSRARE